MFEIKYLNAECEEFKYVREIRQNVFIEEQKIDSSEEWDKFDSPEMKTVFVLVYYNGIPVGTGRIIKKDSFVKIGRIAVLKPYRKLHAGKAVIESLVKKAKEKGFNDIRVDAQTQAVGFYEKVGFEVISDEEFLDAGIPHKAMRYVK